MGSSSDTSKSGSAATGTSDTAGSSATARSDTSGTAGKKVDKKFEEKIQKIHAANQAEVQLGQMAAQKAQSPEVKQFAEKLEQDHQKADQKLTQAAQSAGIQLEGKAFQDAQKDAQKDMQKLQSKNEQDFDKEFVSKMEKEHKKDIKDVKSAADDARKAHQTELATTLETMANGMQMHLDHAKQLKDTVGKGNKAQGRSGKASSSDRGMGSGGTGSLGTGSSSGTSGSSSGSSAAGGTGSTGSSTTSGSTGSHSDQPSAEHQGTGTATKESSGK
ncbi:MAG TPA: DUF4142 domain-containing protein [Anaeromyxobacter sp.]|nr:DUF4142 domain-containing protein [Anaeromyxobacter sp.]